jgi:uncharacterized glyoxalase superfamily protein PhnB
MPAATFKLLSLVAVLYAEPIEPCLTFWTDGLGFDVAVTVPGDGGRLGFASLTRDGIEIQFQSRASLAVDAPALKDSPSAVTLYLEVDNLDAALARVPGAEVVVPRRRTFYGADEVFVRGPCGAVVGLAQRVAEAKP